MGRFQRSDRGDGVDVRRALREAKAEVARIHGEPPEDERGEEQRRLEEVEDAMRERDDRDDER